MPILRGCATADTSKEATIKYTRGYSDMYLRNKGITPPSYQV